MASYNNGLQPRKLNYDDEYDELHTPTQATQATQATRIIQIIQNKKNKNIHKNHKKRRLAHIVKIVNYIKAQNSLHRPALPDPIGFVVDRKYNINITGLRFAKMSDDEARQLIPAAYFAYWFKNIDAN